MTYRIPLTAGRNRTESGLFALVDDEDVERVLDKGDWRIFVSERRIYAANGNSTLLHRFLLDAPSDMVVDHINGDGRDNRRSNLRLATHSQNLGNQGAYRTWRGKPCASKFKGVSYLANRNKPWRATIRENGKQRTLGYFVDEASAARRYDAAAREVFGDFARLNFPSEHEPFINETSPVGDAPVAARKLRMPTPGVVEIPLTFGRGHRQTGMVALVDEVDGAAVSKHRWCVRTSRHGNRYAYRMEGKTGTPGARVIYMHREVLGATDAVLVDHVNGDGLDNRRANLRFATSQQNAWNRRAWGRSSSHKGVSWSASNRKWSARIEVDGTRLHLGWFDDETEAAMAYHAAAQVYQGNFARAMADSLMEAN